MDLSRTSLQLYLSLSAAIAFWHIFFALNKLWESLRGYDGYTLYKSNTRRPFMSRLLWGALYRILAREVQGNGDFGGYGEGDPKEEEGGPICFPSRFFAFSFAPYHIHILSTFCPAPLLFSSNSSIYILFFCFPSLTITTPLTNSVFFFVQNCSWIFNARGKGVFEELELKGLLTDWPAGF